MKLKPSDLWRWDGGVDRLPYFLIGAVLFFIKRQLDRLVAFEMFGREWTFWSYFAPSQSGGLNGVQQNDAYFYATLVALALPFIWTGVVLTLRRLRAARLPPGLIVLFFVPVANLIFFALLSLIPSKLDEELQPLPQKPGAKWLDTTIPRSALGSAVLGVLLTAVFGVGGTLLSVEVLGDYGWGLFVGLPFCLGLSSVLIFGYHERRTWKSCMLVSLLAIALPGCGILIFRMEGLICLLMALPLAMPLSMFGGTIGYFLHNNYHSKAGAVQMISGVFLILPAFMGAEHLQATPPPSFAVASSVEVDAPPEKVWRHVVSFSQLPPPTEFLFRLGIAYPQRAEIHGRGPGAIRFCQFSTGAFVEPIVVWDEPKLLKFSVTSNPAPMEEWTPYKDVHPPHLHGFLVSNGGQFLLTPLPGGRTRLEGTTWYRHTMWPASYWKIWSDYIIHRIHMRVLNHVKNLAEEKSVAVAR